MICMTTLVSADQFVARWSKRALIYGATIAAGLAGLFYFVLQRANQVALSPYGLDPSAYSTTTGEMIARGIFSILMLAIVMFVLWWPIGLPSIWLAGKIGNPWFVGKLEAWVTSDPAQQRQRAVTAGASIVVPLSALLLLWCGSLIGHWRISNANWIVAANGCAARCFAYKVEGRPTLVVGLPIAANSTRMAIVVGDNQAESVAIDKLVSTEGYKGKPVTGLDRAPWKIRWGWKLLDLLNANW